MSPHEIEVAFGDEGEEGTSRGFFRRDDRDWWADRASALWLEVLGMDLPLKIVIAVGRDQQGAPMRTGVHVEATSGELTAELLKKVPTIIDKADKELFEKTRLMESAIPGVRKKVGRKREVTDDDLRAIALVYGEERAKSSRGVERRVATRMNLPYSTARGRIQLARNRGFCKE